MNSHSIAEIADIIYKAHLNKTECEPVRDLIGGKDLEKAYQIQSKNIQKEIEKGKKVVGIKIGLTSFAVQKQLGVDEPDFGVLLTGMEFNNQSKIPFSELMQPKAEAEWAFVLKTDISQPIKNLEEMANAIDHAKVAIEIVGSRIKNWDITITDTIADNASASHFVLGENKIPLSKIDLENCQMEMFQNEKLASEGTGKACMGNPLVAAKWLVNKMIAMGTPLQAGEIILSGALGPMVNINPGDEFRAKIDDFDEVKFKVD
ncbi:MAG: 2-keto-4-pentenoate hydratase [Bacteroidota bacterium]